MSSFIYEYAVGKFGKRIVNKLAKKGVKIISAQNMPGADGSYANGETGYMVDDNGTGRLLSALQVLKMAE
jgi:hypothetical protein